MRKITFLLLFVLLVACSPHPTDYPPIPPSPGPQYDTFRSVLDIPVVEGGPPPAVYSIYKGVGWDAGVGSCRDACIFGAAWHHNWFPKMYGADCCPGFVPTIGRAYMVGEELETEDGIVLTINEPNESSQGDQTPVEGAITYHEIVITYPNHKPIAPTVSQNGGIYWLDQWYDAYQDLYGQPPEMWAVSINCYLSLDGCKSMVTQAMNRARAWGAPGGVYVKEFRFEDMADLIAFVNWMEAQNAVPGPKIHYSIFLTQKPPNITDVLYNRPLIENGYLTETGETYLGLPYPIPTPTRVPLTRTPRAIDP